MLSVTFPYDMAYTARDGEFTLFLHELAFICTHAGCQRGNTVSQK